MTQQVQVTNICNYIIADGAVSAIAGNRIFWGEPNSEDLETIQNVSPGIYITVSVVSETNAFANKGTRVQIRMISPDNSTKYSELFTLREAITNRLVLDCGTIDMNGFVVYGVRELDSVVQGFDEKGRRTLLQDYRFYFVK